MKLNLRWLIWRIWVGLTVIVLIVAAISATQGLRQNNQRMGHLRAAVFAADETDGDVEAALAALRRHVVSHMNADLVDVRYEIADSSPDRVQTNSQKPIQLVYGYYRDTLAAHRQVLRHHDAAVQAILSEAERFCSSKPISERLGCIQTQTQTHGGAIYPPIEPLVSDFYVFDFVSPKWSPDRAGWSIVIFWAAVFNLGLTLIVRLTKTAVSYWRRPSRNRRSQSR